MRLMLLLMSARIPVRQLKMLKLRNIWYSFSSCAIGMSTSWAIESLLYGLVLTSASTSTFIYHSELLLGSNLTFNCLNLLVSGLLCLARYYTRLFQLALFNWAYYWVAGNIRASGTLQMVVIYTCRNWERLLWFLQLLLILILLLPGFKHMYLILLYFLNVLNLLLLQILHFDWGLRNLLFRCVCAVLAQAFWLLKFIDVHVVVVVASGWNDLLLINILWTLIQILLNQFWFWNIVASHSSALLRGVSRVAVAIIPSNSLALFHIFILITKCLESFRLPLVGRAVPHATRLLHLDLLIYHWLVSVCGFELFLDLSIDIDIDDIL